VLFHSLSSFKLKVSPLRFKLNVSAGKFEINPEAEEFLLSLKETKLGVVAVCGKYRTGKSYLLNKLFVEDYFQKSQKRESTPKVSKELA
jgi:hypothetical protein